MRHSVISGRHPNARERPFEDALQRLLTDTDSDLPGVPELVSLIVSYQQRAETDTHAAWLRVSGDYELLAMFAFELESVARELARREGDAYQKSLDYLVKEVANFRAKMKVDDYIVGISQEEAEGLYRLSRTVNSFGRSRTKKTKAVMTGVIGSLLSDDLEYARWTRVLDGSDEQQIEEFTRRNRTIGTLQATETGSSRNNNSAMAYFADGRNFPASERF